MAKAKATINHDTIKQWVEERGGCPAHVKGTEEDGDPGILRIDFPGYTGRHTLEELSWDEFFDAFESNKLAFLYQDQKKSRFSKLVSRNSVEVENGRRGRRKSKANGKQKTDAIDLLMEQHREVEELFDKLMSARSTSQRDRLFFKLADRLAAHSKIEETLFYPAVFTDETEHELRESVEEHLVMKRLLADMMDMAADHPQFMSKVSVLKEVVRHHVHEEENELFPAARKEELEDFEVLGERMKKRYRELIREEPHQVIPEETGEARISF